MNILDLSRSRVGFVLMFSCQLFIAVAYKCAKLPQDLVHSENTKSNNGRYFLELEGKPEKYIPEEKYTIMIKVDHYNYYDSKFQKFILNLISRPNPDDAEDVSYQTGKFELGDDALSRFSHLCPNTVIESNSQPKREIKLKWVAPPPNSGCVTIRAVVIESKDRWYVDEDQALDGYLTKTLCEDFEESQDSMPEVLDFCCACDEAKYEVAFQGNWIRNNHPKGFPEDLFTTRFSDIIGASHRYSHEFWKVEGSPSAGVKELAFNGSTKTLESELMENIANLHTIIKARGLAYPDIMASSYAIFRVDNENHLVSLVSKMMPSPDWIVGVSNMELCLSNCSWRQYRTVNLYPRDVGINDALEYTGNEPSTNPEPTITEITSSNPADPKSPFFDESGTQMKPLAMLHFKLEKLYKKECNPDRKPTEDKENIENQTNNEEQEKDHKQEEEVEKEDCEMIGYNQWSNCSVSCGKGHKTRSVIFPNKPECKDIRRDQTEECEEVCRQGEQEMETCPNIVWSQWTPCSCDGDRTKKRHKINSPSGNSDETEDDINKKCIYKEVVSCMEEC